MKNQLLEVERVIKEQRRQQYYGFRGNFSPWCSRRFILSQLNSGLTSEQEAFITEYQRKVEAFQTLFEDAKKQYIQDGDLEAYKQV